MKVLLFYYILVRISFVVGADFPCITVPTKTGSYCLCNATYCDKVPTVADLQSGEYQLYTSSKGNLGFFSTTGSFSNSTSSASITIKIANLSKIHQSVIGFGGAFTDAAGINIASLSDAAQQNLLNSYFGDDGIEYSLGRVPIGGTDFSTYGYTYDDSVGDEDLRHFALTTEDFNFKIPYILKALELRGNKPFKLYASAWSSPAWTKDNDSLQGKGSLKSEYYEYWAKYYLKFFDAYKENGITFWGVTTQNEPLDGELGVPVQNIGFTVDEMKKWITKYMGPAIRNSSHSDLKIILHDDQRYVLPLLNWFILSDDEVLKYADGVGVHWYGDNIVPAAVLLNANSDKKDLFKLATEACTGYMHILNTEPAVDLGSWDRAEKYLISIFDDIEYDFGGWTDWNLALNTSGGPNWIQNEVDSAIIVNATAEEFYKQPMFYVQGHFSKFIVPESLRLNATLSSSVVPVRALPFKRPDGKIAVVIWNRSNSTETIKVDILDSTEVFTLEAHSLNTLLYAV